MSEIDFCFDFHDKRLQDKWLVVKGYSSGALKTLSWHFWHIFEILYSFSEMASRNSEAGPPQETQDFVAWAMPADRPNISKVNSSRNCSSVGSFMREKCDRFSDNSKGKVPPEVRSGGTCYHSTFSTFSIPNVRRLGSPFSGVNWRMISSSSGVASRPSTRYLTWRFALVGNAARYILPVSEWTTTPSLTHLYHGALPAGSSPFLSRRLV